LVTSSYDLEKKHHKASFPFRGNLPLRDMLVENQGDVFRGIRVS